VDLAYAQVENSRGRGLMANRSPFRERIFAPPVIRTGRIRTEVLEGAMDIKRALPRSAPFAVASKSASSRERGTCSTAISTKPAPARASCSSAAVQKAK
jgi:hypothetical protein